MAIDLADNKASSRDINICLSLFSPYKYELQNHLGYDITKLKDNIRFLEVLINRDGPQNGVIALYFDGAVNYFREMPPPNNREELEKLYKYIESIRIPKITLFEINSYYPLTHSEILGSLFGLNITNEVFGDIIINNDEYYFYATNEISDFIKNNLYQIGNKPITLKEVNIETLKNYQRKYQELSLITSSLRIDTIISKIIKINRTKIKELIKSKSIILNYEVL